MGAFTLFSVLVSETDSPACSSAVQAVQTVLFISWQFLKILSSILVSIATSLSHDFAIRENGFWFHKQKA